ncbi:hypothetical protein ANRL4_04599 [Anaerolineae bacterium]|nr:hypothetical protein ANRL4_04599 [Anaerolineae bacterium]
MALIVAHFPKLTFEHLFAIIRGMSISIQSSADALTKITQMGDMTLYEPAGDQPQAERLNRHARSQELWSPHAPGQAQPYQSHSLEECISHVSTPKGQMPVLKTMVTTACERNCFYCPFRAGRSQTKRVTITPDQLAGAFDTLQRAGRVDGLFLSSGIIKGGVTTQDKLIDTVEIVRHKYQYRGYIHLKIMPGAEYDQLLRAMTLADRVSVNLEAPTPDRLQTLAPKKDLHRELIQILQWAEEIRRKNPDQRLARTVTQFVVGAAGDTDLELLLTSERLYQQLHLTRVYYSAFHPVIQTPLENLPSVDPLREFRLYQASFLLRDYGWSAEDLSFGADGNMPLEADPKKSWADQHLIHTPVDIQTAERSQLLRVPGIGPKGADAILKARRIGRILDLSALRKLGIRAPEQAAPYIILNGRRPDQQRSLF